MGVGYSKFVPHEHPLCLRVDEINNNEEIRCELCAQLVVAPFYACDSCRYYVHKSCGDLPLQINHSFHPSHPLYLVSGASIPCDSCLREFKASPFYICEECDLKMDVDCAMIPRKEGQQCLQHFSHPHSLSLVVQPHNGDQECFACGLELSSDPPNYYVCDHCKFFLHKSCSEFPREIPRHPLHPRHDCLSLVATKESIICDVCEMRKGGICNFIFKCGQCIFQMCWKCNDSVKRNVEFEDHEHALCFLEKTGDDSTLGQCNGYDAYCRQLLISNNSEEFKRTKSSIFRCLDCDFKLHLLCGPLPSAIKHECHIHALTLLDSLVEDDYGEYYCDVCETERDPRIRLYYCEDCKYFAHVHCVISEIVNVLRGDLKDVELMALGEGTWTWEAEDPREYQSTSMTLKDLIDQIVDEEEKKELTMSYRWNTNWSEDNKPPMEEREYLDISEILKLSSFTSTIFVKYCGEFQNYWKDLGLGLSIAGSDLGLKMVRVTGYMIPHSLADVLKTLLNEYGEHIIIGRKSLSVQMKSFILFILCRVVKRMRATLLQDTTKYLLREWFFHLWFVKSQGFEIGFALARAESLVDAFLGLQAQRLEDEVPAELNKNMDKLKQKMDELRQEMAGLKRDSDKCKEYRGSVSQKPEYMKYCMKKASEFRWRNAFDRHVGEMSSSVPREQWKW